MPIKIVKCPSCQAEVADGKHCMDCGAELKTDKQATYNPKMLDELAEKAGGIAADKVFERFTEMEGKTDDGKSFKFIRPKQKSGGSED
jgi:hypothetical protein